MRRLALSYFDDLKYSDEKKKDYLCMKADLLRRTGQFDRLIEEELQYYKGVYAQEGLGGVLDSCR